MVKIVFESDASLRNYREKIEEIKVDACMSACVSLRQVAGLLAERFLCDNEPVCMHTFAYDVHLSCLPQSRITFVCIPSFVVTCWSAPTCSIFIKTLRLAPTTLTYLNLDSELFYKA
jgi:hypothetical protein